ncbi:M28 family peptidase [Aeromicrobium sp. CF3.5]|uniref:M28 family peptidase n=1 Tax=Aeromicrobium sp. CF3.5 TaxID=3373078 RepID=UPI003EE67DD5
MRKIFASAATAALATSLLAAAPAVARDDSRTNAPPNGVKTSKLEQAVTVNGMLQHLREFQVIANNNGGNRASGLPGYEASADYVARTLRQAGYTVKRQQFTFAFSRDLEPATLTQTAPTQKTFETSALSYSGSGDVTGPVVPIDVSIPPPAQPGSTSGCEASDFPEPAGDTSVALIQRGTCDFATKAQNAVDAGYAAVVVFNEGQAGRTELLAGTLGTPFDIPVVGLTYDDGAVLAGTDGAEVRVTASTENDLNRTTENVIADLPASSRVANPDQTIVVGGHLDSVAEGAGINDNGSGSAAVLEIAQQMSELRLTKKVQRPVRFAFWGAEEAGLLGAEHYVSELSSAQRAKIYANLNFDMLGSPNFARFVYDGDGSASDPAGPPGSAQIEDIFTSYFASKNLQTVPTAFDGRSDYGPFIATGIPAGGLFSGAEGVKTEEEATIFGGIAGEAYDPCYHSVCDDITNINTTGLSQMADAAAHATQVLVARKEGLFPDGSRVARSATTMSADNADHPAM